MARVLLIGASGQLGTELARVWSHRGLELVATTRSMIDLQQPDAAHDAVVAMQPTIVLNAAAYTAVDKAESETELAFRINSAAPTALARACNRVGAALVHVSTDYVFDGTLQGREYREDDPVAPINAYGRSKEAGEVGVRNELERHIILRTSWVYSPFGANFVKTMLRLGSTRPELSVVADQVGRPTSARGLAKAIHEIASLLADGADIRGTFHAAGADAMSWYDFARKVFAAAAPFGLREPLVKAISTAEYPTPARRPMNSRLDCRHLDEKWGVRLEGVDSGLSDSVAQLMRGEA